MNWWKESKQKQRVILVAVVAVLMTLSFYFGYGVAVREPREILIAGIPDTTGKVENVNFDLFWEAWDLLRGSHLQGEEKTNRELLYGAISGLASSFDDPYTVFMPPEDSQKFQEDVGGNFGGVGMEIENRDGQLMVVAPLEGTPAARAGVRAGDRILEVDGESMAGIDVITAVKKIRGEVGTSVELLMMRDSWAEPRQVVIKRENIQIPTLTWEIKDEVVYVRLMSFNNNSMPLFYEAVLKSLFSGSRGMVLDLRDNPGGYLEVATQLAGWFVPRGEVVVSEEFRNGSRREIRAQGNEVLKDLPVVVLINKGSASAAEILAGVLRDLKGATLVGETTFGKGTVQELKPLSDGSIIKVTTAHWVLPKGAIIDENGIKPDVEVKITEEDLEAERDPQLGRALQIIREKINQ